MANASFSFLKNRKSPDFAKRQREVLDKKREGQFAGADFLFSEKVTKYTTKDDSDHCIRILPASWDDAKDYGVAAYAHYNVGLKKSAFWCPEKMGKGKCPICDLLRKNPDDKEMKKLIGERYHFLMWVIDRNDEKSGPKLWTAPGVIERNLAETAYDKKTDEYLYYDDVESGYDINFKVKGKKPNIKYEGVVADRRPSPLSDDSDNVEKWLQYIAARPIPKLMNFKEYDHINEVLNGVSEESEAKGSESESTESANTSHAAKEETGSSAQNSTAKEEKAAEPKTSKPSGKPTAKELKGMDRDALCELISSLQLETNPSDWSDVDDLREAISVELGL